jgi:hypothetical protein
MLISLLLSVSSLLITNSVGEDATGFGRSLLLKNHVREVYSSSATYRRLMYSTVFVETPICSRREKIGVVPKSVHPQM